MKKFRCKRCNYIHVGDKAPDICPVCQAPASEFEEVVEAGAAPAKKGLNKNSNVYTFIYMVVMVAIVSLLLSLTSGALKETQNKNVKLDKMKQILKSTPEGEKQLEGAVDAQELFANTIVKYQMLDANGVVTKDLNPVADFDYSPAECEYPLYVVNVNGTTKYIIPMRGAGLWGAIWGYIALNDDRNTIYGVFFAHASETAGLGSEIATTKFRDQFSGKHILNAEKEFVSIFIAKTGELARGQEQVDALAGGTITSKGVETMLQTSLGDYAAFFKGAQEISSEVAVADSVAQTDSISLTNNVEGGK